MSRAGALALAWIALAAATPRAAHATDGGAATVDASGTIQGVYAWSSADQRRVNLIMNVFPQAGAGAHFSPLVQYVFHVSSLESYGAAAAAQTNIICTFSPQAIVQCWIGDADYVTGDASRTAGVTSASGRVLVFTGPRNDPFFFNLAGFKAAVGYLRANTGSIALDGAGCPLPSPAQSAALRGYLAGDGANPSGAAKDFYAGANVLSIVLSVDATLLVKGTNPILSVWGSTHRAP